MFATLTLVVLLADPGRLEAACRGGDSKACVSAGALYEKTDKRRGVELYQLGCRQGHEPACAEVRRAQSDHPVDTPKSFDAEREKAMKPVIEQARRSWPAAKKRYLAGLPKGETFYVTAVLKDSGGEEQVFIQVQAIDARSGEVRGALNSRPVRLKTFKPGDPVTLKDGEVLDWTTAKADGSEEGNFVGKFLDTYQPP